MTETPGEPPGFAFFNEVGIIEHLSRTAAERVMPDGLSMAGFTVLNHLIRLRHTERPPAKIAAALQVTRGAITGTLKRLEAAGWVTVRPDPNDGRAKGVSVTEAGRQIRSDALAALGPQLADLYREIDPAELEAVLPTLRKVRIILDAARDG